MDNSAFSILVLAIFGVIPSIIWLLIFLRKDAHPESNGMILKVFLWGALAALPTVLIEMGITKQLDLLNAFLSPGLIDILKIFIGIALIEELLKYLAMKGKALRNQEFDEPTDAVLYMVIAGLGFAAIENVLALLPFIDNFSDVLTVNIFRFVGAVFLHALCSGTIGYFMALSFYESRKRTRLLAIGLISATFLHGLFNFSIMNMQGIFQIGVPIIILICLGSFVFSRFRKLKKK